MKRGRLVLACLALPVAVAVLAGCTGTSRTPTPTQPTRSSQRSGASSSAPPGSAGPTTSGEPENPALDACPDLQVVPCPRQVNRIALPIAGSTVTLVYASDRQPGRTADPAPSANEVGLGGWSLSDLPGYDPATHREVLPDGTVRTVTGVRQGDLTAIADPSGQSVTTFDPQGRAQATLDAVTGLPVARFAWGPHGLASVTDASGVAITVTRDASGDPTSLQAASTSPMTFTLVGGQLTAIGYPDGGVVRFDVTTAGLLQGITDAAGLVTRYAYDSVGRLISLMDPTGRTTTYQRTVTDGTATVTTTVGGTVVTTDAVTTSGGGTTFTHTGPTGQRTTVSAQGTLRTISDASGTTTITLSPDPRWGLDAALPSALAVSNGTGAATMHASVERAAAAGAAESRVSVDGKIWTFSYVAATRTTTATDPTGLSRVTTLDAQGRVAATTVHGVPVRYAYDDLGRVTSITLGTGADARVWAYSYAPGSITLVDPVGDRSTETVNAAGIVTGVGGPDGTGMSTGVDTSGRITSFAAAGAGTSAVTWGANGLPAVVNAPAGQDAPQFTATTYDITDQPASVTTGDSSVTFQRDAAGRPVTIAMGGNATTTFTYDPAGHLLSATSPGVGLAQSYTGDALTSSTTTIGAAKEQITSTVDGFGRTTSISVDGGSPIGYAYDAAGNLTTAGAMGITRDPKTGWITGRTLGALTESLRYNQFGEPIAITVTGPSGTVASITEQRDALGRVTTRTTTTGTAAHTTTYTYDASGRLTGERTDGTQTTYAYDTAGNITSVTSPSGTTANTYDARNALLRSGSTTFTYDGSGRLAAAAGPAGTTTYHYDALGRLTGVEAPGEPAITYTIDARGRRVANASGTQITGSIAYLDQVRPAASFTAAGALDAVYVYDGALASVGNDGGGPLPAYLIKGGTAYLEIADATGGPALVIDSRTGALADQVTTTALGATVSETHPGFQIFGYAGGIADPSTSLVHIGARDYSTATGRWIAPDPLGIGGGSANLYTYVRGDPVNRTDPRGTCDFTSVGISFGAGLGPVSGSGSFGVAWGGGQFGVYDTSGAGLGLSGDLSVGLAGSCLYSDSQDKSLGNFSGAGSSAEGTFGPITGGSDMGYDSSGKQSSHGGHGSIGLGMGVGGSVQGTFTTINCLFGCPKAPDTVCGNGGCSSDPGSPPADPGGSGSGSGIPTTGARSTGDPHLTTADGTRYDMQAVGEFLWATTDSGSLTVQVRQQPAPHSRAVSLTTAIAVAVGGDRLEFTPPPGVGQPLAMSAIGAQIPPVGTFPLPHGVTVVRTAALTTVSAADGTTLWLRENPFGLDIVGKFPDSLKGKVHGLIGPFTGNPAPEVQTASGESLTLDQLQDYATRYRTFADSWRITQAQSLFTDRPGVDATAFDDPTFPDAAAPTVPAQVGAAATAVCKAAGLTGPDLDACELDVSTTGDAGFAGSTAAATGVVPGATPRTAVPTDTGGVTGDIVPGQTVSGTVAAGQTATYTFTVPAGTVGYFAADPACGKAAPNDLVWSIQDSSGSALVGSTVICDDLGRIVFATTGSYRLTVSSTAGSAAAFAVTWRPSRPDVTRTLQPGQTASGTIDEPGAQDMWTVTVPAGTVAYLAAAPDCDTATGFALAWNLAASDGSALIGTAYICNDLGRVVFDQAGTYRITIASASGGTAPYSVTWETSRPDVTRTLQPGQTASGTIDRPGARDVWTMTVPGATVAHLLADPNCDNATGSALTWTVVAPDGSNAVGGTYICQDLGTLTLPAAGQYRVVVASADGKTGRYSFRWAG